MDARFCPPGFVTDRAFTLELDDCQASIDAFIIVGVLICAARVLGAVFRARTFYIKQKKQAAAIANVAAVVGATPASSPKNKRSITLPLGTMIDMTSAFFYILMFTLVGLNIANAGNGFSFFLFGLCFLPFALGYGLFHYKMVRLGSKIIPFLKPKFTSQMQEKLSTLSVVGKMLALIEVVSMVLFILCFFVLAPALPQHVHLLGRIGFACNGTYLGSIGLSIVYQIQRCIDVIYSVRRPENGLNEESISAPLFAKAVARLRNHQMVVLIFAFPMSVFSICLIADVMVWEWFWILGVAVAGETLSSLAVVVPTCRRGRNAASKAAAAASSSDRDSKKSSKKDMQLAVVQANSGLEGSQIPSTVS